MKVGICDWGIGGLGIYKLLRHQTNWDICYFSDSGHTPYGKVDSKILLNRWKQIELFFQKQKVDVIIIGCNALGTVTPKKSTIFNILSYGLDYLNGSTSKSIGVTGGYRTIESNLFQSKGQHIGMEVITSVGQTLSAHIESGDTHSGRFIKNVKTVFAPFNNTSEVILACTHYPSISKEINFIFPSIKLIDPAVNLCNSIVSEFKTSLGNSNVDFYTTGSTDEFIKMGQKSFKVKIPCCNNTKL